MEGDDRVSNCLRVLKDERHLFVREVERETPVEEDGFDVGERVEHGCSNVGSEIQGHPGVSLRVGADVREGKVGGVADGEERAES